MTVDRLWAGWRMAYIAKSARKLKGRDRCLFCAKGALKPGPKNLVLASTPLAIVMLNLYPYNVGHVMVAPRRHRPTLSALLEEEVLEIGVWLARVERALKRAYRPHGLNLGMNLGRTAGAGVPGHVHWHVVPRWTGDTNFMPVTAATKVMPEALDQTYVRVKAALDRESSGRRRS